MRKLESWLHLSLLGPHGAVITHKGTDALAAAAAASLPHECLFSLIISNMM